MSAQRRVRIGLVEDSDLIRLALMALCRRHPDHLEWAERLDHSGAADVLLMDPWNSSARVRIPSLEELRRRLKPQRLLCFTWREDVVARRDAAAMGFERLLHKGASELVLVASLTGKHPASLTPAAEPREQEAPGGQRRPTQAPTHTAELSAREEEMLRLIMQGHTNNQIARRLYLSLNTVKSYIRSAYSKIGVERRTQAVRWALENLPEAEPEASEEAEAIVLEGDARRKAM